MTRFAFGDVLWQLSYHHVIKQVTFLVPVAFLATSVEDEEDDGDANKDSGDPSIWSQRDSQYLSTRALGVGIGA